MNALQARLAVQTLFDYPEGGDILEDFLEGFPTVSRSLALEALEEAKQLRSHEEEHAEL